MKIFDTKDSKVSIGTSGSFHGKHSVMEESLNDLSEVSNRKFERFQSKDPKSECSFGVCEVSSGTFESFHRKHSELEESLNDSFAVSNRKFV